MHQVRTDLALEAHEMYRQSETKEHAPGVMVEEEELGKITVTRVRIENHQGQKALGKPIGTYVTLEIPSLIHKEQEIFERAISALAKEIEHLCSVDEDAPVLVVGLGNRMITADALGPKVVESLLVTRHMFELMPQEIKDGVRPVSALSPGVLGLTGIETSEIIKGVVEKVHPSLVIAIDALASRRLDRISTTIQIANTGITPGAGIGNVRKGLTEETLGVPVIAIGVPTVVDAATMASDTIDLVMDELMSQSGEGSKIYALIKNLDREEKYELIQQALSSGLGNMVVTPKEVDEIIEDIAKIISNSINMALHKGITPEDVNRYS